MAERRDREWRQTLESVPEIRRFLLDGIRPTGRQLGFGSYGSVEEVSVNGSTFAAKKIHNSLIDVGYEGVQSVARKYVAECQLMSDLRHPNIVQFLGLCFLEGSSLPALVMEKLVASLDDVLENTPDIPLGLKKSFLADVARGLAYLHGQTPNAIIHRDLSAKNVLLNSAMVAKISDLGNSRIVNFRPGQLARTLTRAPGTTVYMPPEALDDTTRYGPSLDMFSFGHLALFTLTQEFPGNLLPPNYAHPDDRRHLLARSEVERRRPYFSRLYQQLSREHPLVKLVECCLDNDPEYRPSTLEVLQQLEAVEIEDPYQNLTKLDMIRLLQKSCQRDEQVQKLQTQMQQMQISIAESEAERERIVEVKDEIIRGKDEVIRGKGEVLERLQMEVADKEQAVRELQAAVCSKDKEICRLQAVISASAVERERPSTPEQRGVVRDREAQPNLLASVSRLGSDCEPLDQQAMMRSRTSERTTGTGEDNHRKHNAKESPPQISTSIEIVSCCDLPIPMADAQAVFYCGRVYVGGGTTSLRCDPFLICIYDPQANAWETTRGPVKCSALAVYQAQLVLAGGLLPDAVLVPTEELWLINDEHRFAQTIPPMNTPTYSASAVGTDSHLIVAGGICRRPINTVQIYDGKSWACAPSLPQVGSQFKTAVLDNRLYLLGGCQQGRQVFSVWLPTLIRNSTFRHFRWFRDMNVWETLPKAPYPGSSAAVIGSQVLAIGGGHYSSSTHSIFTYSQRSNYATQYKMGATLPQPLTQTCSVTLPTGEVMVIGGREWGGESSKIVYKIIDASP